MKFTKAYIAVLLAAFILPSFALSQPKDLDIPYEIVQPIIHRPASLKSEGVMAARDPFPEEITITVATSKRPLTLQLSKSKNLFAADYSHDIIRVSSSGDINKKTTSILPTVDCFYHGKVLGEKSSSVSIDFCGNAMTGYISTSDGTFTIESDSTVEDTKLLNDEDVDPDLNVAALKVQSIESAISAPHRIVDTTEEEKILRNHGLKTSCGVVEADTSSDGEALAHIHTLNAHSAFHPTADGIIDSDSSTDSDVNPHDTEEETDNSEGSEASETSGTSDDSETPEPTPVPIPTKPKRYVELLVFNDNSRYKSLGADTTMRTLQLVNDIASYYRDGNFSYDVEIVLKGQVTFTNGDPYYVPYKSDGSVKTMGNDGLLNIFNWYRANYLNYLPSHDLGMLLSSLDFEDNIRGLATVGSVCLHPSLTGSINQVTFRSRVMNAVTAAHELGHNLGSPHDAGAGYIMQPYVGVDTKFSPQSKAYLHYNMATRSCMNNNPFEGIREKSAVLNGSMPGFDTSSKSEESLSKSTILGLSPAFGMIIIGACSALAVAIVYTIIFRMCSKRNDKNEDIKTQSMEINASSTAFKPYTGASHHHDKTDHPASGFDIESPRLTSNGKHTKSVYTYEIPVNRTPSEDIIDPTEPPISPFVLPSPMLSHIQGLNKDEIINITRSEAILKAKQAHKSATASIQE